MRSDPPSIQSMDFAVSIINLVKELKERRESIISNQIGRSGTSIGANIREAQYAHGKADFISKLQIALKEANETGYWLELLIKTGSINEENFAPWMQPVRASGSCWLLQFAPQKKMQ